MCNQLINIFELESKTISLANNVAQHGELVECPSCGHKDTGGFCSQCGNPLEKKRISIKSLLESILDIFTDFETKYAQTFVGLLTRPAQFIEKYIHGKREEYYIPFKYFFLNLSINFFVYTRCGLADLTENEFDVEVDQLVQLKSEVVFEEIINDYGSLFSLIIIPVYVLCSYLLFPKSKLNLAEQATAITFMMGQLMLLEVAINLISFVFPAFYHFSRALVMFAELGILFVIAHKLMNNKWYHALWKSILTLAVIFLVMRLVLMGTQEVLACIYDN